MKINEIESNTADIIQVESLITEDSLKQTNKKKHLNLWHMKQRPPEK